MTTATKPAYTPTIAPATPTTDQQRALAAQGFRGFYVEANSKRIQSGVRIVRYLLTVMPGGYIKCPCASHKWKRQPCCHMVALEAYLNNLDERQPAPSSCAEIEARIEMLRADECERDHAEMPAEQQAVNAGLAAQERRRAALAEMQERSRQRESALPVDREPQGFSIYKTTERRYQSLEEQCSSDGDAPSDHYQHAYR